MERKFTKKQLKEEFDELLFVACPTEEKEPFFWRWTKIGKKTILDFIWEKINKKVGKD